MKIEILGKRGMYCIVRIYKSISISLLAACAFQKRSRPQQLTLSRSLHAKAIQATVSEGLAQGPYLAARAGFEPTTLQSIGVVSTNAPPSPTKWSLAGFWQANEEGVTIVNPGTDKGMNYRRKYRHGNRAWGCM